MTAIFSGGVHKPDVNKGGLGHQLRNFMPKGPNGQKRPADTIGAAVAVGRIATGGIEETLAEPEVLQVERQGRLA